MPIGYQFVNCHNIFDVKMKYFHRKIRLLAGGHVTETPSAINYVSLVSREMVSIALKLSALNNLPVRVADIQNYYITASDIR